MRLFHSIFRLFHSVFRLIQTFSFSIQTFSFSIQTYSDFFIQYSDLFRLFHSVFRLIHTFSFSIQTYSDFFIQYSDFSLSVQTDAQDSTSNQDDLAIFHPEIPTCRLRNLERYPPWFELAQEVDIGRLILRGTYLQFCFVSLC